MFTGTTVPDSADFDPADFDPAKFDSSAGNFPGVPEVLDCTIGSKLLCLSQENSVCLFQLKWIVPRTMVRAAFAGSAQ